MTESSKKKLLQQLEESMNNLQEKTVVARGLMHGAAEYIDDDGILDQKRIGYISNALSDVLELVCQSGELYGMLCPGKAGTLPETFASFASEIKQIEALLDKSAYIEAKDFLLRLRAHDETVAQLFEQVKSELRSIDIDAMTSTECAVSMEKYVDLRNLFTADPLEKVSCMQKLGTAFDPAILSLAFTGAYTIEDVPSEKEAEPDAVMLHEEKDVIMSSADDDVTEEPVSSDVTADVTADDADDADDEADIIWDDERDEYDELIEEYYGMDFGELLAETGYEIDDYSDVTVIADEVRTQSSKPFSVKKFKEGLRGISYGNRVRVTLAALARMRTFSLDTVDDEFDDDEKLQLSDTKTSIDYLFRKGFIRSFRADGYPTLYLPTKKGIDLYMNKNACEYIGRTYVKTNRYALFPADAPAYFNLLFNIQAYNNFSYTAGTEGSESDYSNIIWEDDTYGLHLCISPCTDVVLKNALVHFAEFADAHNVDTIHVYQRTKEQAKALKKIVEKLEVTDLLDEPVPVIAHSLDEFLITKRVKVKVVDADKTAESDDPSDTVADTDAVMQADDAPASDNTAADPEEAAPSEEKPKAKAADKKKKEKTAPTQEPAPAPAEKRKAKAAMPKAAKMEPTFAEKVAARAEEFISSGKLYCATAYAAGASSVDEDALNVYEKLAFAVNDPAAHCVYTSDKLFGIYRDFSDADYYYQVSSVLRMFFSGQSRYDYNLQAAHDSINGSPALDGNPDLNDLIYRLRIFRQNVGFCIDKYADYRSKDRVEIENELRRNRNDAATYYENDIRNLRASRTKTLRHKRYEHTWKSIFSIDSDLAVYLKAAADDDTDLMPLAADFLTENVIKEGLPISAENIDHGKIEEFIDNEWMKASDKVMLVMHSSDLMGSLRNNLRQHLLKAYGAICNWIELHDALGDGKDKGYDAYAAEHTRLLSLADGAINTAETQLANGEALSEAGIAVLVRTLKEIRAKLDGTYKTSAQTYFYKDFLTSNYVMLGEDFMPDMDCSEPSVSGMDMMSLVERHAASDGMSIISNLDGYCHDNYRSAELAIEYLTAATGEVPEIASTIADAERYALDQLEFTHRDFVSDLDLAQSYGQLDTDGGEDKKSRLLMTAENWRQWAEETHNFGFYNDMLCQIRKQIREDAEGRGVMLTKTLDALLADNPSLERDNADYVARIRATISRQNYLVAEDQINHLLAGDIPQEIDLFEGDYLADFQSKYSYYYKLAGSSGQALSNLVKTNDLRGLSSKDQKGAITLKNTWPNPGRAVTTENLKLMLTTLGINVDKVALTDVANSVFSVRVVKPQYEDERSYGHPIYGFGSKGVTDGFRVIWLSGAYTADALVSKAREIGRGRHTIAFLDYALTESERRRLARKIKEEGTSSIFMVIDRVLYMHLIHNYSYGVTRMLFEAAMPYAYFQPYVFDSASSMPPELFIGRRAELEKIKDPAGVNIVYGGRQLGKSALLKKAKADIDGNADGDRALLIDIKGLDYAETARKIAQALYDEKVISEPVEDETSWPDIARAVKNTLKGSRKIRYLLLLLDEADRFLESCEEVGYKPFDALKDIQQSVDGRFKFVVAGLRNVVRFSKAATSANSVLPHFESLTVKPFTDLEGRMLIEQPLYYLGFRFPNDEGSEDLVPMILAQSNYFPGLIQFFCARLIETLKDKSYGDYDETTAPPYVAEKSLIRKVLADKGFMAQISNKFMITLKSADDEYYYILALILAYLYINHNREDGYTAGEMLDIAKELNTKDISGMTEEQVDALLMELCELNVLRRTSGGRYLFSRYNFLSEMGTASEVDDRLLSYSE